MSIDVLIRHPQFGSMWLTGAHFDGEFVVGDSWDDSDVGSPYMPADYIGQPALMNFPIGCVDRVRLIPERTPTPTED